MRCYNDDMRGPGPDAPSGCMLHVVFARGKRPPQELARLKTTGVRLLELVK